MQRGGSPVLAAQTQAACDAGLTHRLQGRAERPRPKGLLSPAKAPPLLLLSHRSPGNRGGTHGERPFCALWGNHSDYLRERFSLNFWSRIGHLGPEAVNLLTMRRPPSLSTAVGRDGKGIPVFQAQLGWMAEGTAGICLGLWEQT